MASSLLVDLKSRTLVWKVSYPLVCRHKNLCRQLTRIEENVLPASGTAKCLGYLWHHDLSAKPSIDHNILKARKSFFAYGSMGVFQGDLSPLSGRSVVDTCILPILFYGAENWCLSHHALTRDIRFFSR